MKKNWLLQVTIMAKDFCFQNVLFTIFKWTKPKHSINFPSRLQCVMIANTYSLSSDKDAERKVSTRDDNS